TFSRQHYNQLHSWLYTAARTFLLEQESEPPAANPLLQIFSRRGLWKHRARLLKQLRKNTTAYGPAAKLELAAYESEQPGSRTRENNLQLISDLQDRDFLQRKLRQACLMRSHEKVYPVNYDYGLLPAVLDYIIARGLQQEPSIGVYFHAYQCLVQPDNLAHYQALRRQQEELLPDFSESDRRDLFLHAINYCIRRANGGDLIMAREALDLYRQGIQSAILLENGRLSAYTYRNAVALGLRIKEFDWAEQFIRDYTMQLDPAQRDNLFHYNLARLAHARSNPDQALEELRFVNSKDTLFTLTLDTLRAKIYFESGVHDLLAAHLDKMQIFLRRKDPSYHHQNYLNFVRYCRRVAQVAPQKQARKLLAKEIEAEETLTERDWLLERLAI
ncbi:MAG: hypothetical protein AAFU67_00955, partial [Bacteroidota bacterium]